MSQKLVSLDGRPLDFGLNVVFDEDGVHVEGRADSPQYRGASFEKLTDFEITDVEDDYALPGPPPVAPKGRPLTAIEFAKIGYAIGLADAIDNSLKEMPSLRMFLDQYLQKPGIMFEDAIPGSNTMVTTAFARMEAAGFITAKTVTDFLAMWVQMFPAKGS